MEVEIVKESEQSKENDQNIALVEYPKWTLEEIALSKSTLEQIDEMIAYIQNNDKLLI